MPGMMNPPTAAAFAGYHRPGSRSPWRKVCEAATEDACWQLLLAAAGGDKCVTPASADPNERLGDRRRRRRRF
jgi:hypothetical protein